MTHYPNDHVLVGAAANIDESFLIQWISMDWDSSDEENWFARMTIQGDCPAVSCLFDPVVPTGEVRGIVVIDRGSYEEVWIAQKSFLTKIKTNIASTYLE